MENIIIITILAAIIVATVMYLIRSKKRGDKCIGCPHGSQCAKRCNKRI